MIKKVVFIGLISLSSACSSLQIQVDVLNPEMLESQVEQYRITEQVSSELLPLKYADGAAHPEKKYWVTQKNKRISKLYFGPTNIVIQVLESEPFTLKTISFNPVEVAQAASKVTAQSVLRAAQSEGVPISVKGTSTGNAEALANNAYQLAQEIAKENDIQLKNKAYKKALLKVAQAIVNQQQTLEQSTDQQSLLASVKAIERVYDNHLMPLSPTPKEKRP